uniref:Uncharacterized protein n=1 Tax=Neolamprologus brichardi TaxID=32507 RepID=A0A3Q4GB12_NEOBR
MEQRRLLLAVPEITLTLQPLELAEGGGGILVEAVGDCLGLLRLTNQDCVTPEHHRHVLDLVPINPSQDLGPARVSGAISDPVQGVKMDGFLFPGFLPKTQRKIERPYPRICGPINHLSDADVLN